MNKKAFIIAEYNPFHNGHLYHLHETKKAGAEEIICIMSGNFVQRGDIAFCDKHFRARIAVENGADLVLELPLPYVLAGASGFAAGAAKVIDASGITATLSFGATGSLSELIDLRKILDREETAKLADFISAEFGCSHPAAIYKAVCKLVGGSSAALLRDPNSVLAMEYMAQTSKYCPNTSLFAVPRIAAEHDTEAPVGHFAAAKYIRGLYQTNASAFFTEAACYIPQNEICLLKNEFRSGKAPIDRHIFSIAAMSRLSRLSAAQLKTVNGVSQGLENRIERMIRQNSDLFSLFDDIKTKRFTHARIRQALISAVLDIKRSDLEGPLPYVRVLALNKKGRGILREIKTGSDVPFIMNISEAPDCRLRSLDCDAGNFFELCRPVPRNINAEYVEKPFVLS